jgi:hypothetical protein
MKLNRVIGCHCQNLQEGKNDTATARKRYDWKEIPMPYDKLTKIKGDHTRHLEQLWDEIKKLKERVTSMENKKK